MSPDMMLAIAIWCADVNSQASDQVKISCRERMIECLGASTYAQYGTPKIKECALQALKNSKENAKVLQRSTDK